MSKPTSWEQMEREAARQEKRWRQSVTIDSSYEETLERYLKKELVEVVDYYRLSGIRRMTKPHLIKDFAAHRDLAMHYLLERLTDAQLQLFLEVKEQGSIPIDSPVTQKVGWWWRTTLLVPATIDDKLVLFIPKDVRESKVIELFEGELKERAKQNKVILAFTRGLLNTYGVLRLADLYAKLRAFGVIEGPKDYQHVRDLLWVQQDFYEELLLDGNLAVVPGLENPYALFDQLSDRSDLKPVELTPTEVVKRAYESYYLDFPEYKRLALYLEKVTKLEPDEVEGMLFDFGVQLNNQVPFNELLNEIFRNLKLVTPEIMQETIRLAKAAKDVTPHYALKGHTPGSLFQEQKSQATIRASTEIRRNDKCPCGSGKKYKKCCM